MDRITLHAEERSVLGKKVRRLRKDGQLPAHVFGKGVNTEHIAVDAKIFLKTFTQAGETGLIDLKIGGEKIRPVLVRDVQHDPISGSPIHVDFYQVNLKELVKVSVPLELVGEEPESVKLGETIVLQTLNEVEVEALPTDLVEKIEVNISTLKNIDDAITVAALNYDRDKLTIQAEQEEIVVKLAPAVSAEMEALLEEQAAEQAEVTAETPEEGAEGVEAAAGEGEEASTEGEEREQAAAEGGEVPAEGEAKSEGGEEGSESREKGQNQG